MNNLITLTDSSESIIYLRSKDKRLARVIDAIGSISYVPYSDGYSFLVNTIVGQMLSNKVADKLSERLLQLTNNEITPEQISKLSDEELKSIGISKNKVSYIRALTDAITCDKLSLSALSSLPDKDVIKSLTTIKGIGSWSAKMYLIFVLNRQDILPTEDVAFLQSYSWLYKTDDLSEKAIINKCKKWKPYSSIASRYLYKALDNGLTKTPFHLYK